MTKHPGRQLLKLKDEKSLRSRYLINLSIHFFEVRKLYSAKSHLHFMADSSTVMFEMEALRSFSTVQE